MDCSDEISPRCLPYFFSHYFTVIVITILVAISLAASSSARVGPFRSAARHLPFAPDPFYAIQVSDLHITHASPSKTARILDALTHLSTTYHAPLTIVTGDLTDATNTTNLFEIRRQYVGNWIEYHSIMDESGTSSRDVIEVTGNHDLYGVESSTSQTYFLPDYIRRNITSETVETIDYTHDSYRFHFVLINPVKFPYISAPL
jgi:predicted MPP superfamily phosphohydrolase